MIMREAFWPGNEVTVGLYAGNGAGRPGSLYRETTVSGQMLPIGPADRTGSVVRAAFASVVPLTSGSKYWVVLSAPTSGGNTTSIIWWYSSPALVGAAPGLVECTAAMHVGFRQLQQYVDAGTAGCNLGVGAWHPIPEFYPFTMGHSVAFRVTRP
jgi:hypothetical protein